MLRSTIFERLIMMSSLTIPNLVEHLMQGNITALSRAITLIESQKESHQEQALSLINTILPYSGKSIRIGITGVPGVGKSTFIEALGMHLVEQGKKVAVLAIDPSSSRTRGSILGDKTRMEKLSVHPNAFIRPTASGGSLGGITYKTREATLLCETAGFDVIIIETVGVGQSETEVSQIADFFLLLMLAGAGDELQGIKRGIMEMADGVVINKADSSNIDKAKAARAEYARALHFMPPTISGWKPQVLTASAIQNIGIAAVWDMIDTYYRHTVSSNFFQTKRNEQNLYAFQKLLNEQLQKRFLQPYNQTIESQKQDIISGSISPYAAVLNVMKEIPKSSE